MHKSDMIAAVLTVLFVVGLVLFRLPWWDHSWLVRLDWVDSPNFPRDCNSGCLVNTTSHQLSSRVNYGFAGDRHERV
jgi:hypothetical protein